MEGFYISYRIMGLDELLAAERTFGAKTEGLLTDKLMKLGEEVAVDIRDVYAQYSAIGAEGVVPKVFTSGLWVVQTLSKSRRKERQRPNFGPMIYREAFLPAADKNEDKIVLYADEAVAEATALYWDSK